MNDIFDGHGFDDFESSAVVPAEAVATRRQYNPTLFQKARAASAAAATRLEPVLKQLVVSQPELYGGLDIKLKVQSRPKATPGQSKVLLALIEFILTRRGALLTQADCRAVVQEKFPSFAVTKNWTVPLPQWALAKARTCLQCSAAPLSTIDLKAGMGLRDLHRSVKSALVAQEEGEQFQAVIRVTEDAVIINGISVKLASSKSAGRTYRSLRISRTALLEALEG